MISDHPAGTVAGGAIRQFSVSLSQHTGRVLFGRVRSQSGSKSIDLIAALKQGRVQVADVFAGSLARLDPVFELPTLPFVVHSVDEAEQLTCIAEPAYRSALMRAGLHLLFVSPWPPTGLWSRQPVMSAGDVASLRVRTYDAASAAVLQSLGARAAALPIKDIGPLLRVGGLNAVLSSGDGSVGAVLGEDLSNFNAIGYAYPVSFVLMNEAVYEALPELLQEQVDAAAAEVAREQWSSLPERIQANYSRMRRAGVAVTFSRDGSLESRLQEVGKARVQEWLSRVPDGDANIIKTFRKTHPSTSYPCPSNLLEAGESPRG